MLHLVSGKRSSLECQESDGGETEREPARATTVIAASSLLLLLVGLHLLHLLDLLLFFYAFLALTLETHFFSVWKLSIVHLKTFHGIVFTPTLTSIILITVLCPPLDALSFLSRFVEIDWVSSICVQIFSLYPLDSHALHGQVVVTEWQYEDTAQRDMSWQAPLWCVTAIKYWALSTKQPSSRL